MKYIAQIRKRGRLYFQTAPHDSREAEVITVDRESGHNDNSDYPGPASTFRSRPNCGPQI